MIGLTSLAIKILLESSLKGEVGMVSEREITTTIKTLKRLCLLEFSTGPGEAPKFMEPSSSKDLLRKLGEIRTLVKNNGTFNSHSPHAEKYAICLVKQKDYETAFRLFKTIVDNAKINILFLRLDKSSYYPSSSISPKLGKLGYEGVFQYAVACMRLGLYQQARDLFVEIVEKIPTSCYPIRLQDIRVDALVFLKNLGVGSLAGEPIEAKISAAQAHQY